MLKLPKTIQETQEKLLKKEYSAMELIEAYLKRIAKYDGELNSFITVTAEIARNQAKKTDELITSLGYKAFADFPLLGAVVSHKDIYLTKGVQTTASSRVLEGFIAPYSATSVERIEEAGAMMIGKLNCDAWAHGSSGENSDFGSAKNPWNKDYTPGGSSSGSGAATSANFSLFSTSTDTCGSTRLPASYCGVVGLKPTYGSVSRYGVIAMASSLDTIGHITKTVEDSKKIFEITRGIDGKDGTLVDHTWVEAKTKIKIGVPKEFFGQGLERQVETKIQEVIEVYKTKGIEFIEVSLPSTKYAIDVYYIVQPAEVSSNLGRYDGVRYGQDRSAFGDEAKRRIMLGTYVLSAGYYDQYYLKAMKVRSLIIAELDKAFKKVDALIAPVAPTPPFKLGEKVSDPLAMYLTDIFAATANLSGIPGLAIPAGFTKESLPLGFQLMGPRFSENTLFKLGEIYQHATDWHLREPKL